MVATLFNRAFAASRTWNVMAALAIACAALLFVLMAPATALAEDELPPAVATTEEAPTSVDSQGDNRVDPTQRADNSFIYDTTIATILDQSSLYEGRTVQVVGEVIGDRIADGPERCWIMLTETNEDDPASISVLMSNDQANQIDRFGRYGVVGTTLQVRGIYHQACSEHDGQPDIHAANSSVISHGIDKPDAFNPNDFFPGILAVLIGVLMMGAFYFASERAR